MNDKFLIFCITLLSCIFSGVTIEKGNKEFHLKKGDIFSVNSDSSKFVFETFDTNLINGQIDVTLLNSITIYDSKKISGPIFEKMFVGGLIIVGIGTLGFEDTWLFSKREIFLMGATFVLGISTLGGIVGNFIEVDNTIQLKYEDCSDKKPCTKWIKSVKKS